MGNTESFLGKEHTELLEELNHASGFEGKLGEVFSNMLQKFSYHLDREEDTAVPLLEYLSERLISGHETDYSYLQSCANEFNLEFESMIGEHAELKRLAVEAENFLTGEAAELSHLIHELRHHMDLEEEILYPAAAGAKDLIRFERAAQD